MVGTWASRWDASRLDRCEVGHERHRRRSVAVRLGPGRRAVEDGPAAPRPVAFDLVVYDAARYHERNYCSGDDELSRAIAEQGCWEPWQTALTVDLLAGRAPGTFVDLGAHVGWYSMIALALGHSALALDADPEHAAMAALSATRNPGDLADRLALAVGWLDDRSRPLHPDEVGPVLLAKVDLEGAEGDAAHVLFPLLDAGALDYALVELSPEFGSGWREAVSLFEACGYRAHLLPDKGDDVDAFERGPLAATLARGPVPDHLDAQATALFASPAALEAA